jgi:phenylpropionate dioxygenase-like ring-hydroxylating dioxygenase large terminal subunit
MDVPVTRDLAGDLVWPRDGVTRVPFRVFSDPAIYAEEQKRLFRGPIWNFLCLEIEIPNAGDWRLATVGEVPVVVTRDEHGDIHAMVNRCAHKGALVCLQERGNAKALTCVYHSWSYDLAGRLQSVAFRHGVRGKGGMPDDFDPAEHRLEPLRRGDVLRSCVRHLLRCDSTG